SSDVCSSDLSFKSRAATDESTPPLIPTTTRVSLLFFILSPLYIVNRLTIFTTRLAASCTFSVVLAMPKLKRIELVVRGFSLPNIDVNTCEGSTDPAVQALPLDAAIPAKSKLVSSASTFVPGKLILKIEATVDSCSPLS